MHRLPSRRRRRPSSPWRSTTIQMATTGSENGLRNRCGVTESKSIESPGSSKYKAHLRPDRQLGRRRRVRPVSAKIEAPTASSLNSGPIRRPAGWPGCAEKHGPNARQWAVHPPRRTRLPDGIRLRDLRLLPHQRRVPAHPRPATRPRPTNGARPTAPPSREKITDGIDRGLSTAITRIDSAEYDIDAESLGRAVMGGWVTWRRLSYESQTGGVGRRRTPLPDQRGRLHRRRNIQKHPAATGSRRPRPTRRLPHRAHHRRPTVLVRRHHLEPKTRTLTAE